LQKAANNKRHKQHNQFGLWQGKARWLRRSFLYVTQISQSRYSRQTRHQDDVVAMSANDLKRTSAADQPGEATRIRLTTARRALGDLGRGLLMQEAEDSSCRLIKISGFGFDR